MQSSEDKLIKDNNINDNSEDGNHLKYGSNLPPTSNKRNSFQSGTALKEVYLKTINSEDEHQETQQSMNSQGKRMNSYLKKNKNVSTNNENTSLRENSNMSDKKDHIQESIDESVNKEIQEPSNRKYDNLENVENLVDPDRKEDQTQHDNKPYSLTDEDLHLIINRKQNSDEVNELVHFNVHNLAQQENISKNEIKKQEEEETQNPERDEDNMNDNSYSIKNEANNSQEVNTNLIDTDLKMGTTKEESTINNEINNFQNSTFKEKESLQYNERLEVEDQNTVADNNQKYRKDCSKPEGAYELSTEENNTKDRFLEGTIKNTQAEDLVPINEEINLIDSVNTNNNSNSNIQPIHEEVSEQIMHSALRSSEENNIKIENEELSVSQIPKHIFSKSDLSSKEGMFINNSKSRHTQGESSTENFPQKENPEKIEQLNEFLERQPEKEVIEDNGVHAYLNKLNLQKSSLSESQGQIQPVVANTNKSLDLEKVPQAVSLSNEPFQANIYSEEDKNQYNEINEQDNLNTPVNIAGNIHKINNLQNSNQLYSSENKDLRSIRSGSNTDTFQAIQTSTNQKPLINNAKTYKQVKPVSAINQMNSNPTSLNSHLQHQISPTTQTEKKSKVISTNENKKLPPSKSGNFKNSLNNKINDVSNINSNKFFYVNNKNEAHINNKSNVQTYNTGAGSAISPKLNAAFGENNLPMNEEDLRSPIQEGSKYNTISRMQEEELKKSAISNSVNSRPYSYSTKNQSAQKNLEKNNNKHNFSGVSSYISNKKQEKLLAHSQARDNNKIAESNQDSNVFNKLYQDAYRRRSERGISNSKSPDEHIPNFSHSISTHHPAESQSSINHSRSRSKGYKQRRKESQSAKTKKIKEINNFGYTNKGEALYYEGLRRKDVFNKKITHLKSERVLELTKQCPFIPNSIQKKSMNHIVGCLKNLEPSNNRNQSSQISQGKQGNLHHNQDLNQYISKDPYKYGINNIENLEEGTYSQDTNIQAGDEIIENTNISSTNREDHHSIQQLPENMFNYPHNQSRLSQSDLNKEHKEKTNVSKLKKKHPSSPSIKKVNNQNQSYNPINSTYTKYHNSSMLQNSRIYDSKEHFKKKEMLMMKLKEKHALPEANEDYTFQPQISASSNQIMANMNADNYLERKIKKQEKIIQDCAKEYTFIPNVHPSNNREDSPLQKISFEERQKLYKEISENKRKELTDMYGNKHKDSKTGQELFTPMLVANQSRNIININNNHSNLYNTNNSHGKEDFNLLRNSHGINRKEDVYEMNYNYANKYSAKKKQLEERVIRQETQHTRVLANTDTIYEKMKEEASRNLFRHLDSDQDDRITSIYINLKGLPGRILKILNPILIELKNENETLNEMEFKLAIAELFQMLTYDDKKYFINELKTKKSSKANQSRDPSSRTKSPGYKEKANRGNSNLKDRSKQNSKLVNSHNKNIIRNSNQTNNIKPQTGLNHGSIGSYSNNFTGSVSNSNVKSDSQTQLINNPSTNPFLRQFINKSPVVKTINNRSNNFNERQGYKKVGSYREGDGHSSRVNYIDNNIQPQFDFKPKINKKSTVLDQKNYLNNVQKMLARNLIEQNERVKNYK